MAARRPTASNSSRSTPTISSRWSHSRLLTPAGRWGSLNVPSDVPEDYARQLVSEVREIQAGKPVWKQVSEHNHFLDCEALAAAAGRLLNVERIPEGARRDWDDKAPAALPVSSLPVKSQPVKSPPAPSPPEPVTTDAPPAEPAASPSPQPKAPARTAGPAGKPTNATLRDALQAKMTARAAAVNRR